MNCLVADESSSVILLVLQPVFSHTILVSVVQAPSFDQLRLDAAPSSGVERLSGSMIVAPGSRLKLPVALESR